MAQVVRYTVLKTRWGYFGLAGNDNGLVRTRLPIADRQRAKKELLKYSMGAARFERGLFKGLQEKISAYFEGSYVDFHKDIPIAPAVRVSDFRRAVLETCRNVKYGKTISYGELANRAGYAKAARAAGSVMANNWLPLIIPCHRITCANGKPGGFSTIGGVKLKKKMLQLEQNVIKNH